MVLADVETPRHPLGAHSRPSSNRGLAAPTGALVEDEPGVTGARRLQRLKSSVTRRFLFHCEGSKAVWTA